MKMLGAGRGILSLITKESDLDEATVGTEDHLSSSTLLYDESPDALISSLYAQLNLKGTTMQINPKQNMKEQCKPHESEENVDHNNSTTSAAANDCFGSNGHVFDKSIQMRNIGSKSLPQLKKSLSLPEIYSESWRSMEVTEEYPNVPKFLSTMKENQILRENLMKLKTKNSEIIAINHDWDKSYISLIQQHAELQKQFQKHTEQFTMEVTKKEEEKNRLKMKLERFFNEGSLDEKNLLADEKEEKNKILKREQAAIQTAKDFQFKCQHLDHLLRHTNQQKINLEREVQRLSQCVETQQPQSIGNKGDSFGLCMDKNEIDLLRQQLQTYVEDFNAEKNEKQRLLQENSDLKIELAAKMDENQHLKTQLEIYEKDFARQREKRIQELRKSNQISGSFLSPKFDNNTTGEDEVQSSEYNVMNIEKDMLNRVGSLETRTVHTAWSTTCYNSGGNNNNGLPSSNLSPYPNTQQPMSHPSYLLPRSARPHTFLNTDSISNQFLNEKAMRDRGILSRSIPKKSDNYSNFNNKINSTNSCWSYFG